MEGIGLRQRDAFPKGAFKAFPELGGGAAGKGNGKDALSGDAVLEEALDAALSIAEDGDVVVLSPACASFDEFSCFEERGDVFKRLVADRAGKA